ncbi:MAG: alkaline phosphatase family protein [Actinomycetota bacterium]|nr:alkaline phosphatase family protein [Actinomycetota bacterium]
MQSRAVSRRQVLGAMMAAGAAAVTGCGGPGGSARSTVATAVRRAGSRPDPRHPVGTDLLPQIDHIVLVVLENHSFDNVLGMLGRGDGLQRDAAGRPTATNPGADGKIVHAFAMPTPCQLRGRPSQTWNDSHIQYDHGTNQGFVRSASGPVAMGYLTAADLPFTWGLARTFPIGDRYFSSVMAQTYPNRCYLTAGTSLGLVSDAFPAELPPNGTIFELLGRHGISWRNYYSSLPSAFIWKSLIGRPDIDPNIRPITDLYADAAAGRLPAFSLVDPNFGTSSEEDPQDVQYGDVFLSQVVRSVLHGPRWPRTLLIWTYDEHGGYFDHVPPPAAVRPDRIGPDIAVPPDQPGTFGRYGFRVPFGIVSPYARPDYVSHVVHDHTSVLKLLETKWNLPALTDRDANADDLLDSLDLVGAPSFLVPPPLPVPANPASSSCETTGPGTIPPPGAVTAA